MPATTATLDTVSKEVYEGQGYFEQLNNDVVALKRIEKTSDGTSSDLGGKYTVFPIHTKRNTGIGARLEGEALPAAGQQGSASARLNLKSHYGSVQLTGQAIELIDKDYQAFVSALDYEMKGLRSDLAKNMNREVYSDGKGTIATVKTVVTSTTIPVDSARLFNVGDFVDLVTLPATVTVAGRNVTAVDLTVGANTVTVSGAAIGPTVVGQIFVRSGSGPFSASVNREWTGLSAIVSNTGILYNVDPAVEPVWKAEVNSNGGTLRALSEGLMISMADRVRVNGGKTTLILTNLGVRTAYWNILSQQRTYVNTKEFTGGFNGLGFVTDAGEIPIVVDPDAPPNTMWFINEDEIKMYKASDWKFMDRDGSKWQRVITSAGNFDAWGATLYQYSELGTHRRNTHAVLKDLIEG
jgi:hypothetical protein